jgi:hypothetical protein
VFQQDLGGTEEGVLLFVARYSGQTQKKILNDLLIKVDETPGMYEVNWLDSWQPSPKLLVGAHHF